MKFEIFELIVFLLKKHSDKTSILYSQGIDLTEFDSELDTVISHLIGSIYGIEGKDWFEWWCYDKEWGERKDITACDENKNPICESLEDLWNYIESIKTDDYTLPHKMTEEERLFIIKNMFKK
jgi:hypothetical protein